MSGASLKSVYLEQKEVPMKRSGFFTLFLVFCMGFLLTPQTVHAAGFVQDTAGVKYQLDDGSYMKDAWVQVGDGIYRLDKDGNVMVDCWTKVGKLWYQLDENGVCVNPAGSSTAPKETAAADKGKKAAAVTGKTAAGKNSTETAVGKTAVTNTDESSRQKETTVYWTPKGKSYHSTSGCRTLSRSKKIISGTLDEALAEGKDDSCDVCH